MNIVTCQCCGDSKIMSEAVINVAKENIIVSHKKMKEKLSNLA